MHIFIPQKFDKQEFLITLLTTLTGKNSSTSIFDIILETDGKLHPLVACRKIFYISHAHKFHPLMGRVFYTHAPCPMPHAPCPMPHAPCQISQKLLALAQ
ncbi:hypothetical protein [Calothrix parietina]|uniref:hypothetical protein n=1 Tax=Calothrix parietina TaxID=32054 RepID=UPI0030DBA84C